MTSLGRGTISLGVGVLTATSTRGQLPPDFPLYLDGAELVATYPMGPISEGAGVNVTVLSYMDNVDFGFLACPELVPDVEAMAANVETAMAELLAAQPAG